MDIFEQEYLQKREKIAPLAYRMTPRNLDDFFGQRHILGEGKLLRRAIDIDQLSSIILYGPPGTGKTALARIISSRTNALFYKLNAVTSGVADIRDVVKKAKDNLALYSKKSVLFIDEIHRFNKAQQDALLPEVEDGTIVLVGATTENPYFEVNSALISRSRVFEFFPLTIDDIKKIIANAIEDKGRGIGMFNPLFTDEAIEHIAHMSGGDARNALNAVELAVLTTPEVNGIRTIDIGVAMESIQRKNQYYSKKGDNHYDYISAFIKSMRGSDPDASVYWLAKILVSGEDPKFIARRIVICASEDVGNADPRALEVAVAAFRAVEYIGMPEGRIPLAQAAIYVACAPKSNKGYLAINKAIDEAMNLPFDGVPIHLKDSSYKSSAKLGRGLGYKYPHDYPGGFTKQQYLPNNLKDRSYYIPSVSGYEKRIGEYLDWIKKLSME